MALTVAELAEKLNLKFIAGTVGSTNVIEGAYVGDLLSWVMGRAKESDAWITIQGHENIIAVAALAAVSCVVVCESAELYGRTAEKAEREGIPLLTSELPAYELAVKLHEILL